MWAKLYPDCTNTGVLTREAPALDIDILDEEAAKAVEELARDRWEERGNFLIDLGRSPKRGVLLRTDTPFKKIVTSLIAPDGSKDQKVEFLADGQQIACFGIHPDTGKNYRWHGGQPGEIKLEDLPYVSEQEAKQFVADAQELLIGQHGYTRLETGSSKLNGDGGLADRADWDQLVSNIVTGAEWHDSLCALAASAVSKGYSDDDARQLLQSLMQASTAPHGTRWKARFDDIPRLIGSARAKYGKTEQPPGQVLTLHCMGEAKDPATRSWLVDNVLPEIGVGLLSGVWGSLKTFVAVDLSGAVMSEGHFIKFKVRRPGGVLFIAAEGAGEVTIRLQAAIQSKYPILEPAPFAWTSVCPPLTDQKSITAIAGMAQEAHERMLRDFGVPLVLILFDTVVAAAGYVKGGDENDAAINQGVMNRLGALSRKTGALVVGLDHFGKQLKPAHAARAQRRARPTWCWHSWVIRPSTGRSPNTRLAIRKSRCGPSGECFPAAAAAMGEDETGTPITSLAIEWLSDCEASAAQTRPKDDQWSKSLRLLRQVMMNMLADCGSDQRPYSDGPVVRAVDIERARAEFYQSYPATGDTKSKQDTRQKAFRRAIKIAQKKT